MYNMVMSDKMLEFEVTLKCNFRCKYCTNGRNGVLRHPINEAPLDTIQSKILNFGYAYIYGGEPLLYPRIIDLVRTLKTHNKDYVIQTNLSIGRVTETIIAEDPSVKFQVSIHRSQSGHKSTIKNILRFHDNVTQTDVMFTGIEDLKFYYKHKTLLPNIRLIPVADFATKDRNYLNTLRLYNRLRKMLKDVVFDDGIRSFVWEDQFDGFMSPRGKPCPCLNEYFQMDPSGKIHHCPQRYDGDTCPFDTCFNIDSYEIQSWCARGIQ